MPALPLDDLHISQVACSLKTFLSLYSRRRLWNSEPVNVQCIELLPPSDDTVHLEMKLRIIVVLVLAASHACLLGLFVFRFFFDSDPPNVFDEPGRSTIDKNSTLIAFFFISGGHLIPQLQAYSVISACKHHPLGQILIFRRPWMRAPQIWSRFSNLAMLDLNETDLLTGTPLMEWYMQDWTHSDLYDYHLGDALRLAFLYKFGGIYLDTDVILLKSLDPIPWNSLAVEDNQNKNIDGAVMKFQAGHPFLELAMQKFVSEFRDTWAYQGPALMTRTAEEFGDRRPQLNVLPFSYFYPLSWRNFQIRALFKASLRREAEMLLEGSYAVHLWNKATKRYVAEKGSVLQSIIDHLIEE